MKKIFFFRQLNIFLIAIVATAVVFLLPACSKDDDGINTPVAGFMAFNLVPDKQGVTVTLSNNVISPAPMSYTSYTGAYLNIFTGQRTVQAYDYNTSNVLTSSDYTFNDSSYYSLFVVGANNNYKNVIVEDNFDNLSATSGKAYIRYINAIPDSSDPVVTIAAGGSNVVNTAANYSSVSDFVEINPGSVTITVDNDTNIDTTRTITLEQGKAYTVLLVGVPGETGDKVVQIRYIENGTLTND